MNKVYDKNNFPKLKKSTKGKHIGILGCGNYAYSVIAFSLNKNYGKVVKSSMDINLNRTISFLDKSSYIKLQENCYKLVFEKFSYINKLSLWKRFYNNLN